MTGVAGDLTRRPRTHSVGAVGGDAVRAKRPLTHKGTHTGFNLFAPHTHTHEVHTNKHTWWRILWRRIAR
jgi:hypothetical protein